VSQQLHMGKLDEHTVYEAEVVGTILALDIICSPTTALQRHHPPRQPSSHQELCHPKMKHSQYLINTFHSKLCKLLKKKPHLHIHVAWVPGHSDVELNELSDAKAKEAATGTSTTLSHKVPTLSRPLPRSAAALKATHKKSSASAWK
ncbi:hypothetical protein K439DRAFT_1356425, partial [Ramaria rubella]